MFKKEKWPISSQPRTMTFNVKDNIPQKNQSELFDENPIDLSSINKKSNLILESPKFSITDGLLTNKNDFLPPSNSLFFKENYNNNNLPQDLLKYRSILAKLKTSNSNSTEIQIDREKKDLKKNLISGFEQRTDQYTDSLIANHEINQQESEQNNLKKSLMPEFDKICEKTLNSSFNHDLSVKLLALEDKKRNVFAITEKISSDKRNEKSIFDEISKDEGGESFLSIKSSFFENSHLIEERIMEHKEEKLFFEDIISDQETLEFLNGFENEICFQEFYLKLKKKIGFELNEEEELEFLCGLQDLLTMKDDMVSLNALEILTKENGLTKTIYIMIEEIRKNVMQKQSESVNQMILKEFTTLNQMLEKKKNDLINQEKSLKEYEASLIEKEENLKNLIEGQYNESMARFDQNFNEKHSNLLKKFNLVERNLKSKLKLLENKLKESKVVKPSPDKSKEDKYKSRIQMLEKNNEFLKLKVIDLERKNGEEKEINETHKKKILSLQQKNLLLEKNLKDLQKESDSLPSSKANNDSKLNTDTKRETRIKTFEIKTKPKTSCNEELNTNDLEEENDEETNQETMEKPMSIDENELKPKKTVRITKSINEETKILLQILESIICCLKTTLPVFLGLDNLEPEHENYGNKLDIGEILYPGFNHLIIYLVDLAPILTKNLYELKNINNYCEIFFKLVNFIFKYRVTKNINDYENSFSRQKIENSCVKSKNQQDHINEIMMNSNNNNLELIFTPISDFWKKKIKKNKLKANSQSLKYEKSTGLNLFSNPDIQNEIITIFKSYLIQSELHLSRKKSENSRFFEVSTNNTLENQKYILMIRIKLVFISMILDKTKKESEFYFECLKNDINNENETMNDFIKKYILENEGLNICFWLIERNNAEKNAVEIFIDILLIMSGNGSHYKYYISEISLGNRINILFNLFRIHFNDNNFCEKLAVIIQKISHHNNLKGKIEKIFLKMLKDKRNELQTKPDFQFFNINLESILGNIDCEE